MIDAFMTVWEQRSPELLKKYLKEHPGSYSSIVKDAIQLLSEEHPAYDHMDNPPDPDRIHMIDDGDYQGTQLFVIAAQGYQPSEYWYVKMSYGSCSGCDWLESVKDYSDLNSLAYSDGPPTELQAQEYLTMAAHVVQNLKKME